MAKPFDVDARHYRRVAYQRLLDAELVRVQLGRYVAATYLAGYAVECILKAVILDRSPAGARAEVLDGFRGSGGHDVDRLRHLLRQRNIVWPKHLVGSFALVRDWTTDLRYDASHGDAMAAGEFLQATRNIVDWCDTLL